MNIQVTYIFMPIVSHKDSFCHRFTRSNQMLDAQPAQQKKLGKENSQHKPTLEDEDMEKLTS